MLFNSEFKELILDKSRVIRVIVRNSIYKSNNIVLAMGRNGSRYLSDMCEECGIEKENGIVDMGIKLKLN